MNAFDSIVTFWYELYHYNKVILSKKDSPMYYIPFKNGRTYFDFAGNKLKPEF